MKKLWRSISFFEWKIVALLATIVIVVTTVPVVIGFLHAPAGTQYNGIHALSPGDLPVYYSYIRQVSSGSTLLHDNFTSEPQQYGTFNIWWWLVGQLNRLIGDHVIIAFQLARVLMIPVFCVSAYLFVSYCIEAPRRRLLALTFILFASGVGLYAAPLVNSWGIENQMPYPWPIDLWVSESITFNALYHSSHFIASITCMLWIFLLFLLAVDTKKIQPAFIAGFVALFFFNFHPYYAPVIAGVIIGYAAVQALVARHIIWWPVIVGALIGLMGLPSVVYHYWLIIHEPVIGLRALQNVTLNAWWPYVVLGFGFLLPCALLGVWAISREKKWNSGLRLLIIWGVVNGILMFSPLPFQSRYTQGTQIVLAILSVYGLYWLYSVVSRRVSKATAFFWLDNQPLGILLFIICFLLSTFYIVTRDVYYFWTVPPSVRAYFYVSPDLISAGTWLDQQKTSPVVLGDELESRFLGMYSSTARLYVAHSQETISYKSKIPLAYWALHMPNDTLALRLWLGREHIDYIVADNGAVTDYFDQLFPVAYRNHTITLYQTSSETK